MQGEELGLSGRALSGERAGKMSPGWLGNASVLKELEEAAGNTRYMFKFLNSSFFTSDRIQSDVFDRHIYPTFFSIVSIFLLLCYRTADSLHHR